MKSYHRRILGAALTAIVAITAMLSVASPTSAAPANGTSKNPAFIGLYGHQDPTYDGVYRQGLAFLALEASGAAPDAAAIRWLLRQQCGNGRWMSFRSDVDAPCGAPDSNATAIAVMALEAIGRTKPAERGLNWLMANQQPGGGWEYSTGWGPDSNSTGLVTQALIAMKAKPGTVSNGGNAFDFLDSVQLGCGAAAAERGALDYQVQAPLAPNNFATAPAAQALARTQLPVKPAMLSSGLPRLDCPGAKGSLLTSNPAKAAAGYLGRVLKANNGIIPNDFGPGADFGTTANAVLSLVASQVGAEQVNQAMARLESAVRKYVIEDGKTLPASASLLTLAEKATNGKPRDVDGVNLIKRIKDSIIRRS